MAINIILLCNFSICMCYVYLIICIYIYECRKDCALDYRV